ncbi:MAG TPA: TolC family protein, partial [Burkholderiaceae bacterium]|nr:TolC family protein [Burkholderiaceae bacterium]
MKRLSAILAAGTLQLTACSTQPAGPPPAALPAAWSAEAGAAVGDTTHWWRNFQDPQLDTLVDRALLTNNDFAAAAIRVRRAQLQAALVDTNPVPSVSANAFSAVAQGYDPKFTARTSGLSSLLSFEVDLWGKLDSQRQASRSEAEATVADCRAFAASLVGTTAKLYWQLGTLNQLLAMADADIEYARRTLQLARTKFEVGSISKLNAAEAELSLSTQQAAR